MKYKSFLFLSLTLILIAGLFFRLIALDKPEGLWNDEYVSYMISAIDIGKGFFQGIVAQCHMPLYYLYLKSFIALFGQGDLVLRMSSVIAGMASIVAMFFVGKQAKNNNTGLLCATVTAFSSFLIYYSQEVRFYSLLFFFSALLLLFTIRLNQLQTKINAIGYILSSFLVLFTHTIGFVFVAFNLAFTTFWLSKLSQKNPRPILIAWTGIAIGALLASPFVLKVFFTESFSQWWGRFSLSKIGFLFTDYFSPILTNLVNAPDNFFYDNSLTFLLFGLLSTLIAIIGLIKAMKNPQYRGLFLVCTAFTAVMSIAAICGKLVFITKYSIEIYPILILLMSVGLLSFENKNIKVILIALFLFLNLNFLNSNQHAAMKIRNNQGHKIVADLLQSAKLKDGDIILIQYYDKNRFQKYFNFDKYTVVSLNKGNFNNYISADTTYQDVLKNGKTIYKPVFESAENKFFRANLDEIIFSKMKRGQKLALVLLDTTSIYSPVQLKSIAQNDKLYNKTPMLFLVFSYLKNQTMKECMDALRISRYETKGAWAVVTFEKD